MHLAAAMVAVSALSKVRQVRESSLNVAESPLLGYRGTAEPHVGPHRRLQHIYLDGFERVPDHSSLPDNRADATATTYSGRAGEEGSPRRVTDGRPSTVHSLST